jgi:hypothetical protein
MLEAFARRVQERLSVAATKDFGNSTKVSAYFTYMKSTLLAAIFGITGGVAILFAAPVVYIVPATSAHEYGAPMVPQIEEEVPVPEPLDHYSVDQAKTNSVDQAKTKIGKQAPRRHRYVARRPNFFEKLFASFIKLQKHQPPKSSPKRSGTTSRGG